MRRAQMDRVVPIAVMESGRVETCDECEMGCAQGRDFAQRMKYEVKERPRGR